MSKMKIALVSKPAADPIGAQTRHSRSAARGCKVEPRHRHCLKDTLRFAEDTGVRPMIEKYPLDKINEAYNRMTSGTAHFSVVLAI